MLVSVFLQSHGYGCAPFTRHGPRGGAADRVPAQASKAWWSDLGKPISREVNPRSRPIRRVAWPDRCAPLLPTTLLTRRRLDSMPLLARRSDGANRPSAAWKPPWRPLPACARPRAASGCPFPASRECGPREDSSRNRGSADADASRPARSRGPGVAGTAGWARLSERTASSSWFTGLWTRSRHGLTAGLFPGRR